MKKLAIVWRNPDPLWRMRRWRTLQLGPGRGLYIIQELVSLGGKDYWTNASSLEIIRGGRVRAVA